MSQFLSRLIAVGVLLTGCVGYAASGEFYPVPDGIEFTVGPKAGPATGQIATTVDWVGPQLGIAKVEIKLYETIDGKEAFLAGKDSSATLSPGTWAYTFTGLTKGKVITRAYTRTSDVSCNKIIDKDLPNLSVTVP